MGDWCEVYAYGLRNPYRFSFDRDAGAIAVEDVGDVDPSGDEEIDFLARGKARGANFGWNVFEGRKRFRKGPLLLSPAAGSGNRAFGRVVSPTSFGEDALGRIYVASFTGGVYRLASS